jgi:hypothetical protein
MANPITSLYHTHGNMVMILFVTLSESAFGTIRTRRQSFVFLSIALCDILLVHLYPLILF